MIMSQMRSAVCLGRVPDPPGAGLCVRPPPLVLRGRRPPRRPLREEGPPTSEWMFFFPKAEGTSSVEGGSRPGVST